MGVSVAIICCLIGLIAVIIWGSSLLHRRTMIIRSQRRTHHMLNMMAQELLTPLTIISASIEKMRSEHPGPEKEYALIEANVNRSVRLLQKTLALGKTETGEPKLLVSQSDVMQHIKQTALNLEPLMNGLQLTYNITCSPKSMMGWIDSDKIDKIISDLLSNAAKYTETNGKVTLDANVNDRYDHIIITISDTGIGIPREEQDELLQEFHRWKDVIDSASGLALTRHLIYLHHGTIHCDSIMGKGTTIKIEIPINKEAFLRTEIDDNHLFEFNTQEGSIPELPEPSTTTETELQTPMPANDKAYHILIAEDNIELSMLMTQVLAHRYHVTTVSNGQEALDTIQHKRIDLVVAEATMPQMDGYELTTHVKQNINYRYLPVILMTSRQEDEYRMKAFTTGADGLITKPFKLRELQLRIDNMMANRQRIQSAYPAGVDNTGEPTAPHQSADQEFIARAVACIHDHITDTDYDRETFAADMGTSVSTLYNKIRALTGKSVTNFVRDIRIRQACRLAESQPELRVSDIAYQVGFKDPKYFATSFKRVMGIQPKEFFLQLRNQE